MKVKNIYDFLSSSFPPETACDFDNVGLLIGDGESEVKKALIALDCNKKTIAEAKLKKCNLIITHHPVIFSPLKNVLSGSIAFELISSGISVISMHTNLDIAENGGVNDCLCNALDIKETKPFIANDGYTLRFGKVSPISADCFAEKIKQSIGGCVKYVDGGRRIESVLVCSGSGGEFLAEAVKGGFDALVTADVKHHQFLEAADNCISLFDAGHFNTEDVVIEPLCEKLAKEFLNIEFVTTHQSSIKYK